MVKQRRSISFKTPSILNQYIEHGRKTGNQKNLEDSLIPIERPFNISHMYYPRHNMKNQMSNIHHHPVVGPYSNFSNMSPLPNKYSEMYENKVRCTNERERYFYAQGETNGSLHPSEMILNTYRNGERDLRVHQHRPEDVVRSYPTAERSHFSSTDAMMSPEKSLNFTESMIVPKGRFSKPIPIKHLMPPEIQVDPGKTEDASTHKRRKRSKQCDKSEKICAVCGYTAKSMHFGGMACDSCKAFFRRSVQNNSYKNFICNGQKRCPVVKDNRRICQYCRFEKCLSTGMKVDLVMSGTDRLSLWRTILTKHRKTAKPDDAIPTLQDKEESSGSHIDVENSSSQSSASDNGLSRPRFRSCGLKFEDREALDYLVTLQDLVFKSMPYPTDCNGDTTASMANLFYCICQKLRSFFFRLEDFREIPSEDQPAVLRNGIATSIYLHGAYNYDVRRRTWPDENARESLKIPNVSTDTLRMFTVLPEMFDILMIFYDTYGEHLKDEIILVLLCLISLFHDSTDCLSSRAFIQNVNNRYICLLRNYLTSREGEVNGNYKLTQLLEGLIIIKKVVYYHQAVDIRHSVDTVKLIRKSDDSLRNKMVAVSFLLTNAIQGNGPTHSSILTAQEKVDIQLQKSNHELSFRRPQYLPEPRTDYLYFHPITNAMFQPDVTDRLFSFGHKNILGLKPKNLVGRPQVEEKSPDNPAADMKIYSRNHPANHYEEEGHFHNRQPSLVYDESYEGTSSSRNNY